MQAIELLTNRQSQARLQAPAPSADDLELILQAAMRAPDHACLKPWRFVVCEGEGLTKLGEIYEQAAADQGLPDREIARAPQLPTRAPMVIVAICRYRQHDKVPRVEQIAATACAVHAMQMAAVALGYGGMWRTGAYARNDFVKQQFDLAPDDEIVGFLYLGTPGAPPRSQAPVDFSGYVEYWR